VARCVAALGDRHGAERRVPGDPEIAYGEAVSSGLAVFFSRLVDGALPHRRNKPRGPLHLDDVPTGNNPAGEVSGCKHFVDGRPANACVLRGELDGDAETLLEWNVDFLASNLQTHLASTLRVDSVEGLQRAA